MRYVKWTLISLITLIVFGFAHYTLPQHDVVRITGTEVIRQDFSGWNRIFYAQPDSGNAVGINRDLRLIYAAYPDGGVMVYRNEDTSWGWPPYFKFDTSNLQGETADLESPDSDRHFLGETTHLAHILGVYAVIASMQNTVFHAVNN